MAAESQLEKECRKRALAAGCELLKWVSPGVKGVPDRILLMPNARIKFIEFKAKGFGRVSVAQARWGTRLQELGFEAWLIDNLEAFEKLLPSK